MNLPQRGWGEVGYMKLHIDGFQIGSLELHKATFL